MNFNLILWDPESYLIAADYAEENGCLLSKAIRDKDLPFDIENGRGCGGDINYKKGCGNGDGKGSGGGVLGSGYGFGYGVSSGSGYGLGRGSGYGRSNGYGDGDGKGSGEGDCDL